jgi:hypothetical protein
MKKLSMLLLLIVLSLTPIRAQTIPATANLTASDSGACTTPAACLTVNVTPSSAAAVIQLTGTFSATLQFEGTTSSGGTFVAIAATPVAGGSAVTSATATGSWRVTASGFAQIRVRCSAFTSGTVVAAITLSTGSSGTGNGSSGGAVSSVFGRTGAVAATSGDYTLDQIGNPAAQKTFTVPNADLPVSIAATGVFTNGTPGVNGPNIQGSLNSCSPSTEWLVFNRAGTADTEAMTGCVTIGAGSTATQATGVAGYANVSSTSTNGVGGYFQGVCAVTGVKCWGINPLVESLAGHPALFMQNEIDVNVNNSGDVGTGLEITGAWAAQPTQNTGTQGNMPAVWVQTTNSANQWTAGFACAPGATENGTTFGNCIDIGPVAASASKASQAITFHSRTAANAPMSASLIQGNDGTDKPDLIYVPTASNHGTFMAVLPVHGAASGISPLNLLSAGHATLSGGTIAVTFTQAYATAPECVANGHTTANAMLVSSSTTAVTITSSSGADTQVVSWFCSPAAN